MYKLPIYIVKIGLSLMGLCWLTVCFGQADSMVVLSKNFQFEDGIYLSYASFQNNTPDYRWEELKGEVVTNPQTLITQVARLEFIEQDSLSLSTEKLWGLSLGGIPYIRLPKEDKEQGAVYFAGISLRGTICFFSFQSSQTRKIPMPVYNPYTGRPYQVGYVEREETVIHKKILQFKTGLVADFTFANFREWIADDPKLINTIDDFSEQEVAEKLFKCLLIYDDRHEVLVQAGKEKTTPVKTN